MTAANTAPDSIGRVMARRIQAVKRRWSHGRTSQSGIPNKNSGADPIVSNVATASAWRAQSHPGAPLLHGFLVRKAEKAHGTGRRIEGFSKEGARVVIVDDVCTTGASTINAIEAAREAGMTVAAVVCIVEREDAHGRPAVEAAAGNAPFLRLFTASQARAEHLRQIPTAVS